MTSTNTNTSAAQVSVWYFVGATFIFASTSLFFPDAPAGVRIAILVAGFVVMIAGAIQLGREIRQRKSKQ